MNEEYEVERQIESLVNMDLSLEDMPSHENNAKALVVGAGVLVPYILGQVANFLFEETICLLETHALPLTLSSFIKANFCGSFIKCEISFKGLSLI